MQTLEWLERSSWAVGIRQSLWLYPALEIVHILGIVMLVGAAFLFDLRLLGFSKKLLVSGLATHLLPWSRRGLLLIIPSGLLLFITNAQALGTDFTFWLKVALIVAGGLNAWIFHRFIYKTDAPDAPAPARISAVCSILIWVTVVACGRLLAY